MHDQLATLPARELVAQRGGAAEGVEVEDARAPLAVHQAGGLVRTWGRSGGDDEVVIAQRAAIREPHRARRRINPIDLGEHQVDPVRDEPRAWLDELPRLVDTEGQQQQAGLVEMLTVL